MSLDQDDRVEVSHGSGFRKRGDRSLGWVRHRPSPMVAMESKQAAALAKVLRLASIDPSSSSYRSLPSELLPFPAPSRRRKSLGHVALLILAWIIAIQLCYLGATAILISIYRYVDPPATVLMAYREWRFGWKVQPPRPVKLAKVPRYIRTMLVAIEDGKFYEHHGIDFEAFKNAREINKRVGKPLYGGSTLTMQVARTLFLVPEKSYLRKYLEVLTALELEALLPKTRILELYFGYAEWGKGIFGMEAAARKWYGHGIASLSRDEACRLIALLSSPIKYGPETLNKSGILRERYAYLSRRFDAPPAPEAAPASASAATAETAPPPAEESPKPSLEPGDEADSAISAEAPPPAMPPEEPPASSP
jgi:monofunctional glycosyltransferase